MDNTSRAIDELYQYVWLSPERTEYYDFNDVLINSIGAGIGLIIIRTKHRQSYHFKWPDFLRSIELKVIIGLILLMIIGSLTDFISYGPDPDASFCFLKRSDIPLWRLVHPKGTLKFHIVRPWEGLFLTICLLLLYSGLQRGSVDIFKRSENN